MSDSEDNTKVEEIEAKEVARFEKTISAASESPQELNSGDDKESVKDEKKSECSGDEDEKPEKEKENEKENDKESPKKTPTKTKETKKEVKKDVKEEEEEEEDEEDVDEEDDDDDEEEDGDKKVPLLDQPLEVSGTRERKKVQRFSEEFKTVPKENTSIEIPEGKGVQLGEIPIIEHFIQKMKPDQLKPLHRLLFNQKRGKATVLKKFIRKFNGFDFKKGSEQYDKKRSSIQKVELKTLKEVCTVLALEKRGTKEEIIDRILEFLLDPQDSGKIVPTAKKGKGRKSGEKRKSLSRKSKTKRRSARSKSSDSEDEDGDDDEDEEQVEEPEENGGEESDGADESMESEDEEPKKKKRAPAKKNASRKSVTKNAEKTVENKKAEKAADKKPAPKKRKVTDEGESDGSSSSSEDEPLVKKAKEPPTDDEIKALVKQILEGANLEEITMKTVCKQVYAAYPDFDLAHKKDFIKTTVKSLIST